LLAVIFELLRNDEDRAQEENHRGYKRQHSRHFHKFYDGYKNEAEAIGVPDDQLVWEQEMILDYVNTQIKKMGLDKEDIELKFEDVDGGNNGN
jgi:hypothetical protein